MALRGLGGRDAADWSPEPSFAPVALDERASGDPGAWTAAAEPIDVTDHTVELPALAPPPAPGGRRALRATLALALGCAGVAVAASGVLRSKDGTPPPVRIGASSTITAAPKPHANRKPVRHAPRRRRRAPRRVAVAPAHVVAVAPATPAPARAPVRRVVSRPAPRPVAPQPAPKPAPKPLISTPVVTVAQPAPSAPSGEPGRQPPPPTS